MHKPPSHLTAILQAFLVTLLWSSSWVLIRVGLADIPALTFAGLRYSLAFLILLPFFLQGKGIEFAGKLPRSRWIQLLALGVLYYAVNQGAVFIGLALIPAVSASLILNLTPVVVAFLGIGVLAERLSIWGWVGVLFSILGTVIYYLPLAKPDGAALGYGVVTAGMVANSLSAVIGRGINRSGQLPPLSVTTISMGIGAFLLLLTGVGFQGLPYLPIKSRAIVTWLAVVNTALAFTLWNHTLRTLTATESSVINNTMLAQIALLAWLFLGEDLDWKEIAGLVVASVGVLLVQIRRLSAKAASPAPPTSVPGSLE